jgi:hypothetical protein
MYLIINTGHVLISLLYSDNTNVQKRNYVRSMPWNGEEIYSTVYQSLVVLENHNADC